MAARRKASVRQASPPPSGARPGLPPDPALAPTATGAAPATPRTDDDVAADERAFVTKLNARIARAVQLRDNFDTKVLPLLRRMSAGTGTTSEGQNDTSKERANLVFATQATLLPHIYAKNPEIAITPNEAVSDHEYDKWKAFCKTAQAFLNRVLVDEGNLKRRAKANVLSAMTTSIGWLKVTFQENIVRDPLMVQRTNDMQDNLRSIEALIAKRDRDQDLSKLESDREELRNKIAAQQKSNEVRVFKGFTVDRVQTEDVFVLDESIVEFDGYIGAREMAHRIWMTDEEYEQTFGQKPMSSATTYDRPGLGPLTDEAGSRVTLTGSAADNSKYRAVFETWNHADNRVYTTCMGQAGYCREPYTPDGLPQRWYPFYGLAFNRLEGRFRPLSDVELIRHLQVEYSETRHLFAEARKEAIPTRVFRKGGSLTPEDIENMANRRPRQWIGIEGNPQVPLAQEFMQLEGVKIDPAAYDVTLIRNDIDMMVGLSDASRANLIQAKTATEAEIMQQSLMNRVAERQDTNEDMISDMAVAALEVSLQKFTKEEVQEVVGEGAVWREDLARQVPDEEATARAQAEEAQAAAIERREPAELPPVMRAEPLSVEAIFHRISAHVRAGSTGRPNQMKEREQWATLLPVITETAAKVAELRTAGQFDLADTQVNLLRETLRRFDERIDVDTFIPKQERGPDGQPNQQSNAMQQMQEKLAAAEQMQAEFEKCKADLQKCQQDLAIAKQAEQARIAEANAQHAIKTADATAKAEIARAEEARKESVETQRIRMEEASRERIAAEEAETARYNAIISMGTELYKLHMAPQPPSVGPDGQPGPAAPEPDIEKVMTQITTFAERVTEVADRVAGIITT